MSYALVQLPPPDRPIRERSRKELEEYFRWFFEVMEERIRQLTGLVRASPGWQIWRPDYTPSSLESLGDWFPGQVETRLRTQEEINQIADALKFPARIPINERTLSERTLSLSIDVGMYLGQVMIKNHSTLKWEHYLPGKRFADHGQPVVTGFGRVPLNPVRITQNTAHAVLAENPRFKTLKQLYNYWVQLIE
jgi:hypothetical protein